MLKSKINGMGYPIFRQTYYLGQSYMNTLILYSSLLVSMGLSTNQQKT